MLEASPACYAIIEEFEGLRLDAYHCSAGVCTIGWGHTGPDVKMGQRITKERADELLRQDIAETEGIMRELIRVPLTQNQHDALVSFVFNIKPRDFEKSAALALLNSGRFDLIPAQLRRWVNVTIIDPKTGKKIKVVQKGLVRRREAEVALFMKGMEKHVDAVHVLGAQFLKMGIAKGGDDSLQSDLGSQVGGLPIPTMEEGVSIISRIKDTVKDKAVAMLASWFGGKKAAAYLNGKKTLLGAVMLLLWAIIYAFPIFLPNTGIGELGKQLQQILLDGGLMPDDFGRYLLEMGSSVTLLGFIDKLRKWIIAIRKAAKETNQAAK